jgi:hypothetical protein
VVITNRYGGEVSKAYEVGGEMLVTQVQLQLIGDLLDGRGFVLFEDVPIGTDGEYASNIRALASQLASAGYSGNPIRAFASGEFKGDPWDYGAIREGSGISHEIVQKYVVVTSSEYDKDRFHEMLARTQLTVCELTDWRLGVCFKCNVCGNLGRNNLSLYGKCDRGRQIDSITGKCRCGETGVRVSGI